MRKREANKNTGKIKMPKGWYGQQDGSQQIMEDLEDGLHDSEFQDGGCLIFLPPHQIASMAEIDGWENSMENARMAENHPGLDSDQRWY